MNSKTPRMHFCTELDVENDLTADKTGENAIEKEHMSAIELQPTKSQTSKDKETTVEKSTVQQTRDA